MKNIWLLILIFLVLLYSVYAINTFTVQETEKLSLQLNATDPDKDKLIVTYTSPLDDNGEWQTAYGDAGEYNTTITVSDGATSVSEDILIIVNKKEVPPEITSSMPEQDILSINEADSTNFSILATDLNKDELSYTWFLDGKEVEIGNDFAFDTSYNDAGTYKISVVVSDGTNSLIKEWNVDVADVDVESLLEQIKDVNVNENEIIRLELPNFEKYKLSYSISEPIGNDNEWQTTNDDNGTYEVIVHAEGPGFSEDEIVNVVVNDVDRPLTFDSIGSKFINENEELKISLNAHDPDGDEITYAVDNMPESAVLDGNSFTWKPSHDTVRKEDFVDWVMDKLKLLSKSFYLQFSASSRDKKIIQNVIITVKDVNRAPVVEDIEPITIKEGETLKILPNAYDLDGDKISLSYSGFINSNTFESDFDDAGTYYVKITASDGLFDTSKFVQINIEQSNRAPLLNKIQDIQANEGDAIAILLDASDPDGDELVYFMDNPPEDAYIKGNAFFWTPGFDVANKRETKRFDLVFVVSDGKAESRQIAKAEINDKNRPPKIVDATKNIVAKVNEPVLMFVEAFDEDEDELTYTWDFGILEKYKATSTHLRTFTSKGTKVVKVTVSDGTDEVEQIINVNVV